MMTETSREQLHIEPVLAAIPGAVLCFGLRLVAIRRGWQLPVAPMGPNENEEY